MRQFFISVFANADVWAHTIAKSASELSPELTSDINANLAAFGQALIGLKSEMQMTHHQNPILYRMMPLGILRKAGIAACPQAVTNGMGLRPSPSDMANLRAQTTKQHHRHA